MNTDHARDIRGALHKLRRAEKADLARIADRRSDLPGAYGLLWLLVARAVRHQATPEEFVDWIRELPEEDRSRLASLADLTRDAYAGVRGPYRALFATIKRAAYVEAVSGEQVAA